jgi:hypothetical protein
MDVFGLRNELCYILDPQDVYGPDFPGETFRVLKKKEIKRYGEYRTRRLVLEAWDRLEGGEIATPVVLSEPMVVPTGRALGVPKPVPEMTDERVLEPEIAASKPSPRWKKKPQQPAAVQPALSHFSQYRCAACGELVLSFERKRHQKSKHGGKRVGWTKVGG